MPRWFYAWRLRCAPGGLIGYGRAKKRRSAGMRTYMLTCTGAALTMLIAMYEREMLYGGQWAWAAAYADIKFDTSRFSAQVINGVGFLAAGTILRVAHQQVSGLTTAIGLFVTAGIGIAAGSGFYEGVLIAVPLVIVAMELMSPVEMLYKRRLRNITVSVEVRDIADLAEIKQAIREHGATLFGIDVERTEEKDGQLPAAILSLKMAKGHASHSALLSSMAELPCVCSVRELIS
ncbi:MAG: MgtC/SapB family protein [Oscillibacter sp.]|nr:MgtC/SapB family protein [Oscillibacter sp.]